MKKLFLLASAAALIFSAGSCAPEDPATPVNVNQVFPKTKLSGVAYLNENTSTGDVNGGVATFVPEGTVLSFSIPNGTGAGGLNIKGHGGASAEGNSLTTTTVGANGVYEVMLPVRADGVPVTATISSQTIAVPRTSVTAKGSVDEVVLFNIPVGTTVALGKDIAAQKRVDFTSPGKLTETPGWVEATYSTTLTYDNGKAAVAVPNGTQVVLTIARTSFVPARENDLQYVATVGDNGKLEVKMPAPTLAMAPAGLAFTMNSAFVANYTVITNGNEVASPYVYSLTSVAGTLYGGVVNAAASILYTKGASSIDLQKAPWKPSKFTVKFLYANDRTALGKLVGIPNEATLTITAYRSSVDPTLKNLVVVMTYEQFVANGITFDAPDPAVASAQLSISIDVNFIKNLKTGTSGGNDVFNQIKFSYAMPTNALWGGIDKKGGTKINDGNGNDIDNAINIEGAATKDQLTNN